MKIENYSNVYITSDFHFWHKNIIKYCNRPYEFSDEGAEKMNEDILSEIDKLPENSLIINNGDLSMGQKDFSKIKEIVDRMHKNNKTLWLIMGNHDRELSRFLRPKDFKTSYEVFNALGFDIVYEYPIIIGNYILSHEPVNFVSGTNFINLYGHTHDKDFITESPKNYINVCWDKNHKILTFMKNGIYQLG